ncbi:P-loop containing nucleoside triphosphate hydrolase protein [Terfezia boudieri ATCC MYA-4762]|uniref:P-loop containing nucleoside triphosphate hydrolase protein n=1 Tax=Terfezia boudieri ATCC MYA-4762 TaxID=1051890 RepID=A0A3N4LIT1_9PEZI|nr:P-loop containing nucleoside triphosphate hydrolase protein [Terfezia boudieri ATCC MYA-4762]
MPPSAIIIRDKTPSIISFLLPLLQAHRTSSPPPTTTTSPPFFLGISGIQGAGKTTLTTQLHRALTSAPYHLRLLTLSIDDLYLSHDQLTALSSAHPLNPFLHQRGPPGTHDVRLGELLFKKLANQDPLVAVPAYDKSAHGGRGDRVPEGLWRKERAPWDVVVLEGWCVGFTPIGRNEVERRWRESIALGKGTLRKHRLADLEWLDEQLMRYQGLWGRLQALVQVDAQNLDYVYEWRLQQEHDLIKLKGAGMSDDQVKAFVDNYMPSYELYLPGLAHHHHLRFVVGRDRNVVVKEEN